MPGGGREVPRRRPSPFPTFLPRKEEEKKKRKEEKR